MEWQVHIPCHWATLKDINIISGSLVQFILNHWNFEIGTLNLRIIGLYFQSLIYFDKNCQLSGAGAHAIYSKTIYTISMASLRWPN
jgi:hypothetical protein